MFARSSTIHAQPAQIDAGIAYVNHTVMPAMSHLDGFVGLSLMVNRDSGQCIATSAWRDDVRMRESNERATAIRDGAATMFGGPAEVDEWEVVVMHRSHHAHTGTCVRVTWSKTAPELVEDSIETFKFDTLAKIEDLPGFCSASLMVNTAVGRSVVTVGYDDRESLELSRRHGAEVRNEAMRAMNANLLEVAEFDLEVAHLHVPEMV